MGRSATMTNAMDKNLAATALVSLAIMFGLLITFGLSAQAALGAALAIVAVGVWRAK
jgi:hypothetical protein